MRSNLLFGALACALFGLLMRPAGVYAQPVEDESLPKPGAIRMAIQHLARKHGQEYLDADEYLARLDEIEATAEGRQRTEALRFLRREALLANPVLDFDRILLVRRGLGERPDDVSWKKPHRWMCEYYGLPLNLYVYPALKTRTQTRADDAIAVLEKWRSEPALRVLARPEAGGLVADLDLHWDADRLLFSTPDAGGRWCIYEMRIDGSGRRRVTPVGYEAHAFDPIYLPDGRIIFAGTSTGQVVPCVASQSNRVIANLHRMEADGSNIRRLCVDQDQNYTPVVDQDGTVLYTRWQYTEQAHFFSRVLMRMNPDGTSQRDYYGSSSYWPTSLMFVRPVPDHPTRFVGIVSGHHGTPRMGEMVLFDPALGTREDVDHQGQAPGVVQRFTDRGEVVEAVIKDYLVDDSWPKFLHPYPLGGGCFLAAAMTTREGPWGIYLVDEFDNMVLLYEEPNAAMFEPIPIMARERPPVVPDRVDPARKDATVSIGDIYEGPGLAGVPQGSVKSLRLYAFNYPPQSGHRATQSAWEVGNSCGWDVKVILGTVPVEEDGSAMFTVPANVPFAVQPLDAEGKGMQMMRTWMTAMPGENLSCAGCHEKPDHVVSNTAGRTAFRRRPSKPEPWYGPSRGFDFQREVQPVLERRCVGCHDGQSGRPDLRAIKGKSPRNIRGNTPDDFSRAYNALQRYVYRHGPEGEMPVLIPMEYHADASILVQMLRKGHHGVELTAEEWDRIITWIDLNAPYYGSWAGASPMRKKDVMKSLARRQRFLQRYAGIRAMELTAPTEPGPSPAFIAPEPAPEPKPAPEIDGWPLSGAEARRLQAETAFGETSLRIELGDGIALDFVWVPPGSFAMGSREESPEERPMAPVRVEEGFWMSRTEISNALYARFDPAHNSRYFNMGGTNQLRNGFGPDVRPMNEDGQPVVRVSWQKARVFCRWLGEQADMDVDLPTEAQWEWACRAGSARSAPLSGRGSAQAPSANCAGVSYGEFHYDRAFPHRAFDPDWDDGVIATEEVGSYAANAWGLHDMLGNAAEWTRSLHRPYPYRAGDGRNDSGAEGRRVVRGGAFSDRPKRCTASYRLGYHPWQGVYNVGFRVIIRPVEQ